MTKYNYGQIEQLWISNGGSRAAAAIAAAIAMAESSGDSGAINHNTDGSTDRGLFQINSVHGAKSTFDVNANVKAAIAISNNGSNWRPWVTYTTNAYRKYLNNSAQPSPVGGTTPVDTANAASWYDPFGLGDKAAGAVTDGIEAGLTAAFKAVFGPMVKWAFWLGETAIGFAALFLGAQLIVKQTPISKKGTAIATTVATKGAVKPKTEEPEDAIPTQAAPQGKSNAAKTVAVQE